MRKLPRPDASPISASVKPPPSPEMHLFSAAAQGAEPAPCQAKQPSPEEQFSRSQGRRGDLRLMSGRAPPRAAGEGWHFLSSCYTQALDSVLGVHPFEKFSLQRSAGTALLNPISQMMS